MQVWKKFLAFAGRWLSVEDWQDFYQSHCLGDVLSYLISLAEALALSILQLRLWHSG